MSGEVASGIDYPELLRSALLAMVEGLVRRVAEDGLPGDHHFYLTFGTREPGVVVAPRLAAQYPQEMTIVLQHQFWNLVVAEGALRVTLRFGGSQERLTVPFRALRAFADPSVGFAVRLVPEVEDHAAAKNERDAKARDGKSQASATPEPPALTAEARVVDFRAFKRRGEVDGKDG